MRIFFTIAAAMVAATLLSGCGDKDQNFTGAYRFSFPTESLTLNVQGNEAKIFARLEDGRIVQRSRFTASSKGEKLFLDFKNNGHEAVRLVLIRNIDERSLDCLNCKEIHFKDDKMLWRYDPHGPYDVDKLLEEQAAKEQEQARKDKEEAAILAARLATYEGWVEHQVDECAQKGVSRNACACVPKEMKKLGFSESEYMRFTRPDFKVTPENSLRVGSFNINVRTAAAYCIRNA